MAGDGCNCGGIGCTDGDSMSHRSGLCHCTICDPELHQQVYESRQNSFTEEQLADALAETRAKLGMDRYGKMINKRETK